MFGMGWAEMLVVAVVFLIVFGPERLPEVARRGGRAVAQARHVVRELTADVQREIGPGLPQDLRDLDPRAAVRRLISDESVDGPKGSGSIDHLRD